MAWHPLGHVLATASNDHSTKFWSRQQVDNIKFHFHNRFKTTEVVAKDYKNETEILAEISKQVRLETGFEEQEPGYFEWLDIILRCNFRTERN